MTRFRPLKKRSLVHSLFVEFFNFFPKMYVKEVSRWVVFSMDHISSISITLCTSTKGTINKLDKFNITK
jgi:hypothetical protein